MTERKKGSGRLQGRPLDENGRIELTKPIPHWHAIICEEIEECAKIVDACNRTGPYNAIGAAGLIRGRKSLYAKVIQS